MVELRLTLSDQITARFRRVAQQLDVPLEEVVSVALELLDEGDDLVDSDDQSDEAILDDIREGMQSALAGDTLPAHVMLEQIEREIAIEEALRREFGATLGSSLRNIDE